MNPFKAIFKRRGSIVWFSVTLAVIALLLVVTILVTGPFRSIIGTVLGGPGPIMREGVEEIYTSDYDSKKESKEAGDELNVQIASEGFILLMNDGNGLPIRTPESETDAASARPKISVFGKNSVNLVYGGSGSGGGSGEKATTLYEALEDGGFDVNPTLQKFYEGSSSGSGRGSNPTLTTGSDKAPTLPIGETPIDRYTSDIVSSFREYNDAALVVISRIGGESFDLPRAQDLDNGGVEGRHYLQLDKNEEDMLKMATDRFDKVIVVLNTLTSFQCDFIDQFNNQPDDPRIDAVIWIGGTGVSGINAIGDFLNGNTNPSGKTTDIYAKDFTKDPTWQNFGDNTQVNDGVKGTAFTENGENSSEAYVAYEEGIYIGYRYYETRAYEERDVNPNWYEQNVRFPFGHGLSYSTFTQSMQISGNLNATDSKLTVTVNVENTSAVAGKDVVQLYVTLPYTEGGIEKSRVQLVDFAKTGLLAGGGKETVTFTVDAYDLASYDYNNANGNDFWGYELDPGDYIFYVAKNSHIDDPANVYATATVTLSSNVQFAKDPVTGNDVVNRYSGNEDKLNDSDYRLQNVYCDDTQGESVTRKGMSRADFEGTFPKADSVEERAYMEGEKDAISNVTHNNTDVAADAAAWADSVRAEINPADPDSVTDKEVIARVLNQEGDIMLRDLLDEDNKVAYNDEDWEKLLRRLSISEMTELINDGAFKTAAIVKIGKNLTNDSDGPIGFVNFMNNFFTGNTTFSSEVLIAATWNKDLAYQMGRIVGDNGVWGSTTGNNLPYSGWYAPAVNLHRSPFSGRNFEYYSEDPVFSGKMAVQVINGAASKGVYTDLKHFAVNDQETDRSGIATYLTEQSLRELYLKPFEIAVKGDDSICNAAKEDGITEYVGSSGIMSSFNRIGTRWTGGDYRLMTQILRDEWGFVGLAICDYKTEAYMNSRQMVYAGNDLILVSLPELYWNDVDEDSIEDVYIVRQSAKNILYTVVNSNSMNVDIVGYYLEWWITTVIVVDAVAVVALAVWGFFSVRKSIRKMK